MVPVGQLQVYLDEFVFAIIVASPGGHISVTAGLGTGRKSTKYEQIRGARDLNPNLLGHADATG
jgi:hypothetical protein